MIVPEQHMILPEQHMILSEHLVIPEQHMIFPEQHMMLPEQHMMLPDIKHRTQRNELRLNHLLHTLQTTLLGFNALHKASFVPPKYLTPHYVQSGKF